MGENQNENSPYSSSRSYQNRLPGTVKGDAPSPVCLRSSTIAHGSGAGNERSARATPKPVSSRRVRRSRRNLSVSQHQRQIVEDGGGKRKPPQLFYGALHVIGDRSKRNLPALPDGIAGFRPAMLRLAGATGIHNGLIAARPLER